VRNQNENVVVRFIRELKVPVVVAFIVATVWAVAVSQRMEQLCWMYRLPATNVQVSFEDDDATECPPMHAEEALSGVTE
jgi:hypothetical protein